VGRLPLLIAHGAIKVHIVITQLDRTGPATSARIHGQPMVRTRGLRIQRPQAAAYLTIRRPLDGHHQASTLCGGGATASHLPPPLPPPLLTQLLFPLPNRPQHRPPTPLPQHPPLFPRKCLPKIPVMSASITPVIWTLPTAHLSMVLSLALVL
jgi:hypothetical protein